MSVNQDFLDEARRAVRNAKDRGVMLKVVRMCTTQLKIIEGEFAVNPPGQWGPQIDGVPIEVDESVPSGSFQLG
jgi:hypothetical protein